MWDNSRTMSKQQIHKRICPEAIARVLRQWNDGTITTKMAMEALDVSRPQLYRLRTTWLGRGKKKSIKFNVSGGDHSEAWPKECVEHLTKMLESSGDHGPDYALYADELDRIRLGHSGASLPRRPFKRHRLHPAEPRTGEGPRGARLDHHEPRGGLRGPLRMAPPRRRADGAAAVRLCACLLRRHSFPALRHLSSQGEK